MSAKQWTAEINKTAEKLGREFKMRQEQNRLTSNDPLMIQAQRVAVNRSNRVR